ALGCVVDGCPPGIPLTAADIQVWLDERRPGQGKFVTQRQEPDAVRILSGVFEDERTTKAYGGQVTTGTPISLMIDNVDQRSRDYSDIFDAFRPGHADYAYFAKYGVRDYRGGGRQSARETAARVAAGAIARKVLGEGVEIGSGFASAALSGEENADEMRAGNDGPMFLANNAGGVLGGISTGQSVVARVAFKPTSSILSPRKALNEAGEEIEVRTKGRHDPCVGIRAAPVVEAMTACVLADAFLRHRGQTGGGAFRPGTRERRA